MLVAAFGVFSMAMKRWTEIRLIDGDSDVIVTMTEEKGKTSYSTPLLNTLLQLGANARHTPCTRPGERR